jgi:hypothetical protein
MCIILEIQRKCNHLEHHVAAICAPVQAAQAASLRNGHRDHSYYDATVCEIANYAEATSTAFCADCFYRFIEKFRSGACPICRDRISFGLMELEMELDLRSLRRGEE